MFLGSLGIASNFILNSRAISIILLVFLVFPLPLMGILLKRFTRGIFIQLYPEYFTFEIIDKNGSKIHTILRLNELRSYCIQFPNDKFNTIKFRFKDGKSFEYSFFQKKPRDADIDSLELIDIFQNSIKKYNNTTTNANKIIFQPSFYATNAGLFCIIGLSVSFIGAILLFSLYNAKSLPVTFVFSFILILQLTLKRKKDLDYYKKYIMEN
jgi:hypothetical protein